MKKESFEERLKRLDRDELFSLSWDKESEAKKARRQSEACKPGHGLGMFPLGMALGWAIGLAVSIVKKDAERAKMAAIFMSSFGAIFGGEIATYKIFKYVAKKNEDYVKKIQNEISRRDNDEDEKEF